jgi:hypothetical protein
MPRTHGAKPGKQRKVVVGAIYELKTGRVRFL